MALMNKFPIWQTGNSARVLLGVLLVLFWAGSAFAIFGSSSKEEAEVTLTLPDLLKIAEQAASRGELPKSATPDFDPQAEFWAKVFAKAEGRSSALATAARERLTKLLGPDIDLRTVQLLAEGKGQAMMPDGATVDWATGTPTAAPRPRAEVRFEGAKGEIRAGDPIRLLVSVTNEGKGSLYQFRAKVVSSAPGFVPSVLLFGKIDPNGTVTRRVTLPTPETHTTGDVTVSVQFHEANGYTPDTLISRAHVTAGSRPVLAMAVRVIDDGTGGSVGNGDGVVQKGEAVDLRFDVKNTGDAPAVEAELDLRIMTGQGVKVFGATKQSLGTLRPGEVKSGSVNVSVQSGYTEAKIPIMATLMERGPFTVSHKEDLTLTIDEKAAVKVIALDRPVYLTEAATLLNGASDTARSLGRVEKGTQLRAVGDLGGFLQVEYQTPSGKTERAWLQDRVTSFTPPTAASGGASVAGRTGGVVEFVNAPPLILFSNPVEGETPETEEEEFAVKAVVKDDRGLATVVLRVNGQALAKTEDFGLRPLGQAASPIETAKATVTVARRIKLQEGANRIALEAVDTNGETQRSEVVITRVSNKPVDVSVPPPSRSPRNRNNYAVVIGVEAYRDLASPALYAKSDAESMRDYLVKAMGYPEANVRVLTNERALRSDFTRTFETWLPNQVQADSHVFVFYSGHGAPEPTSGETFLVPYDGQPDDLATTAYPLKRLYEHLNKLPTDRVVVVVDACFSGQGQRSVLAKVKPLVNVTPARNLGKGVVLTATNGAQTSSVYEPGKHGLLTYFLLKGLRGAADANHDRAVDLAELYQYVEQEVPVVARKLNVNQTPELVPPVGSLGAKSGIRLIELAE